MNNPVLSTYRLQFHPGFSFSSAEGITEYLADLGITHIYASPILRPVAGSEHGYDQVDPAEINPELGGTEGFLSLWRRCRDAGLGWIQDIVPNHMAFSGQSPWVRDVLEKGPHSPYARHLDLQWDHPFPPLQGRLMLPFLGAPYCECLENADLKLTLDGGSFHLDYFRLLFPLCLRSYPFILRQLLLEHSIQHPWQSGTRQELEQTMKLCSREEDSEAVWAALRKLRQDPAFERDLQALLQRANSGPRNREWSSFLDTVLRQQHYQPSHWRTALEEINYRRFFSINDLICLRQERETVFRDYHAFILELVQQGLVQGLRIDHLDGLWDPSGYLQRLRRDFPRGYLVVEKILDPEEQLPDWPVQGTTGYDFLFHLNSVFCDPRGEEEFELLYSELHPCANQGPGSVPEQKRHILEREMGGDLQNLLHTLETGLADIPCGRDISRMRLREALSALAVSFPVYRTYFQQGRQLSGRDAERLRAALHRAGADYPRVRDVLNCLEKFFFSKQEQLGREASRSREAFLLRLQQTTGPLAAKGFEDTHLYTYNRLISLNEVGGDPHRFGLSAQSLHSFLKDRAENWPLSLSASATHDTKRGEDVRARLNVLSEMPRTWREMVWEWLRVNEDCAEAGDCGKIPDASEEYLLYQTLLGSFPFREEDLAGYRQRVADYLVKALREAKRNSTWHRVDEEYEQACLRFLERILPDSGRSPFLESFLPFQRRIAHWGLINSLSQLLVKLTSPGVPDVYQGTELWDLSLVDPDNRRPVDYEYRRACLQRIKRGLHEDPRELLQQMLRQPESGLIKMHLLRASLWARRENSDLFRRGEYIPLQAEGERKQNVLAFYRRLGERCSLTVVPRLPCSLVDEFQWPLGESVWGDTRIEPPRTGRALDYLSGQDHWARDVLYIGDLLQSLPASLLSFR